jgi:hypothetical protein
VKFNWAGGINLHSSQINMNGDPFKTKPTKGKPVTEPEFLEIFSDYI